MLQRFIFSFMLLICINVNGSMCGKPENIEDVRDDSSIFEVTLSGYIEDGVRHFNNEATGRHISRPYQLIHFNVVSTIKGLPRDEIYVIYYLDKGLGGYVATPPAEMDTLYLLSFINSKTENGSINQPFSSGPCELQKRI